MANENIKRGGLISKAEKIGLNKNRYAKKIEDSFPVSPFFKIPSFMFDLRVITAKCVINAFFYMKTIFKKTYILNVRRTGSFSFSPTSHKRQFYGVTRGFTRLIIKTKNVCHGLISSHANFCNIRIK